MGGGYSKENMSQLLIWIRNVHFLQKDHEIDTDVTEIDIDVTENKIQIRKQKQCILADSIEIYCKKQAGRFFL